MELYDQDPLSIELIAMQLPGMNSVPHAFMVVKFVIQGIMIGEPNEARISSEEALASFGRIRHWG